jgi:hypothetical protein
MYEDLVYLLGDARASGVVSHDRQKKPAPPQAIPELSGVPPLAQTSSAASFAIDPVLVAILSEMISTQGMNSENVVHYLSISTAISLISISNSLIRQAPQTRRSNVLPGWRMRVSSA